MLAPDRNNEQTPRGFAPRAADGGPDFRQAALAPGDEGFSTRASSAPSNFLRSIVAHVPEIERRARLRALAAIVRLILCPAANSLASGLRNAETDDTALDMADTDLARLPALTSRRILSAWTNSF